ncbi:coiled-coil domain-containing protein 174 [Anoplophora glabripennis]|nr:coiled-coil domain-containing protein 174 [Anoplophora glabripennis]
MSTYEISKSSLLSLKAEIIRKQQELIKTKADNEVKIKTIKKNAPLEIKNKGIEARQKNDITEEEEDLLKQSKSILEAKSKLYDKLSSGKLTEEEKEHNKRFLVRFDKKNNYVSQNTAPIDFEDSEPERYPESDDEDRYHSDEDEVSKHPGEKWVDYTDCLGRTRKCLQKDLVHLKSKDEELKKTIEAKNKKQTSSEEKFEEDIKTKDEDIDKKLHEDTSDKPQESELLSNDMRRELLRQQWEKEEEDLRNKSNIHYQDILFGEARTHGVGYYGFSKDEEERAKQQQDLKKLRDETEAKQKRAQELKAVREKQLAARIKAAKDRRRTRLGLPPEEDPAPNVPQPEEPDEDKKKQEELKRQEEEKERLLEEARQKHIRPWDIGKEGVKKHYEMTQEEWVDKKRDERPKEFAPPQAYNKRDFRSSVKASNSEDTDKSLKFTTKKSRNRNKNKRKMHTTDTSHEKGIASIVEEDVHQSVATEPTPIEDLCTDIDFDDRLLAEYSKAMHDIGVADTNGTSERKGAEIAPPPTYEYYGPSGTKRPKSAKPETNIQNSIEAGLKFLRKQVEEKQKTSRHRIDYTLPY